MDDHLPATPANEEPPPPESPITTAPARGARIVSQMLIACGVVLIGLVVSTFVFAALESTDHDDRSPGQARPQMGDHWHASYTVYIGDERQPNMPTWESGVHTHDDGIIHIHPFQEFEEGSGAALTKFFEYGGGVLTETELRIPGTPRTYQDGDQIPGENSEGHIYIAAAAAPESERKEDLGGGWALVAPAYIPLDGDRILIFFSTEKQMRNIVAAGGDIEPFPTVTPVASVVLTP